jgi:dihydrofolate reductase
MRKLIVTEFMSLDGIIEEPTWTASYWGDDIGAFKKEELFASDALLLGRVTYQGFAAAWPSETDAEGFADRMNGIAKYVVSTTLDKAEWNHSSIIRKNVVEEVHKLKQQPGQDILVGGSSQLIQTLIAHDLVDQYNLLVYPVVLGKGKRLFQEGSKTTLKLVETKSFLSGVVALIYTTERSVQ